MEKVDIQVPDSWNILQSKNAPEELYAFHKYFSTGEDIIVSIKKSNDGYEVRSSAVSRTTEPTNSIHGITATLGEAARILEARCRWWDEILYDSWKDKPQ